MDSLFDFTQEYLQAFEAIQVDEESGEVIGFEDLEAVNARLEDKMEAVACYIKSQEGLAGNIKAEEVVLMERRIKLMTKVRRLKKYLMQNMEAVGKSSLETPKCKISFRGSSRVEIVQPDKLPDKFWAVSETRRPNKTAIKQIISEGGSVPGAVIVEVRNINIK